MTLTSTRTGIIASLVFLSSIFFFSHAAVAETVFYVDPNWGGQANGSASTPWRSLDSSAWGTINAALASDSVTVYFSARVASSDTDQTTTTPLQILRTNTSSRRLTLDGMSQYNTSDTVPSWLPYSGSSRFRITVAGSGQAAVTTSNFGTTTSRNYVTLRGFRIIGGTQGAVIANASHWIIELNDISNSGTDASGVALQMYCSASLVGNEMPDAAIGTFGTDVIIRNNTVHDSSQEAIYIGGYYKLASTGTTAHVAFTDMVIENNTIYNAGRLSEGNCIDIKDGQVNMIVRGNTCQQVTDTGNTSTAIVVEGCAVIERNYVANFSNGIALVAAYHSVNGRNGCEVRNNILVKNTATGPFADYQSGIELRGVNDGNVAYKWTNTKVYDNTIYGNPVGVQVPGAEAGHDNITVTNNILSENTGPQLRAVAGLIVSHTNNLYFKSAVGTLVTFGSNSYTAATITSFEATAKAVDPQLVNPTVAAGPPGFKLRATSPASGAAVALGSFTNDYSGLTRVIPWDMGAWALLSPASAPAVPTALTVQ